MAQKLSPRRRGGQPGNVNRLKHGLYSRRLVAGQPEMGLPTSRAEIEFQIMLARKRIVALIRRQESASLADWIMYERAVVRYLGFICSLVRLYYGPLAPEPIRLNSRRLLARIREQSSARRQTHGPDLAELVPQGTSPDSFSIRTSEPLGPITPNLAVDRPIRTEDSFARELPQASEKRSKHEPDK